MAVEMERDDALTSSLYITDIGYYPKAINHFRERKIPINQYVLIFCISGAGWYSIDSKKFEVCENQYFILPANKPHAYASFDENPWTIYWVHFTGAHAAIYSEGAQCPQEVKPGLYSRINERNNIFEEIFNTLHEGYGRENLRYASSLLHHYLASMRYLQQYRKAGSTEKDTNIISASIHYMKENMEKHLSLKEISNYIGFSPTHFSVIFKQHTGHSPLSYLNLLRVQNACRMLETTEMKINQICHKVGINDCYYFSRMFSKIMGMSPKQYRETKNSEECLNSYTAPANVRHSHP